MADPVSEDVARSRWMAIQALRTFGVAMVIFGIVAVEGHAGIPPFAGYLLIAAGLFDIFLVPRFLARKWRTPTE